MSSSIKAYVHTIKFEADGILSYELRKLDGGALPGFSAGSHIEIYLKEGLSRCYSLLNDPSRSDSYIIAVAKDTNGRGGSRFIHENIHCGQTLEVSHPRNNFALCEAAENSILIAGGIGITPLWSMAQRLSTLGKTWDLHYIARSAEKAALAEEIRQRELPGNVNFIFTENSDESRDYLTGLLKEDDGKSHLYCCGPSGMIDSFINGTQHISPERVHFEFFSARNEVSLEGGFLIELAKSGKTLQIEKGKTILDVLIDNGVEIINSCREGICGACEVPLLQGQADHRDSILSEEEKEANKSIFVCCSGCKGEKLVLDI
ncbi:Phenoxybenzoate dioxygenase subunit beta [compost metagenome]